MFPKETPCLVDFREESPRYFALCEIVHRMNEYSLTSPTLSRWKFQLKIETLYCTMYILTYILHNLCRAGYEYELTVRRKPQRSIILSCSLRRNYWSDFKVMYGNKLRTTFCFDLVQISSKSVQSSTVSEFRSLPKFRLDRICAIFFKVKVAPSVTLARLRVKYLTLMAHMPAHIYGQYRHLCGCVSQCVTAFRLTSISRCAIHSFSYLNFNCFLNCSTPTLSS